MKMVQLLLKYGADPNICNIDRSTPLHEASSRWLLEAARLLLSHGAKVDEKNGEGKTPFQLAASKGHDELMILLVEHGACASESVCTCLRFPNIKTRYCSTCLCSRC